jgi:hypothetical protein
MMERNYRSEELQAAAFYNEAKQAVELYIRIKNTHTGTMFPVVLERTEPKEPNEFCEPSALMTSGEAQALMDSLWRSGIRPTNHKSESALNDHLQDMRAIAFAKLEVPVPGSRTR